MTREANALLGTLRNWYARPALVALSPLPLEAGEARAAYDLVQAGAATIEKRTYAGATLLYLAPTPDTIPCA